MTDVARYRVSGEISRGGWGMVLDGEDLMTRRLVAIKILLPELAADATAVARLVREGRVMLQLAHPNIVRVLDCGALYDRRPFIVMERLFGETLRARIKRERRLPVESAIEIAVQLLSALDAVHSGGVVHRDVKPENIFLVDEKQEPAAFLKLLDFGVCCGNTGSMLDRGTRSVSERAGIAEAIESSLTASCCVIGTPSYMAPEIALGERMFDQRADLYSAGLILHELLTGQRPFDPRSQSFHIAARPPLPLLRAVDPSMPHVLERVVAHALEKDPRCRYQSATEFLHDLLEARTAFRRLASWRNSCAPFAWEPCGDEAPTRVLQT